jgi:perosamine synthetase
MIPYGRQWIDDEDVAAVSDVLRSDWLTTGPEVDAFEAALCTVTGAAYAVAVSSGTAALHAAMYAAGVGPGDEVIVPAMTFAASANAVVYCGARPVIVDVDRETLLLSAALASAAVTPRTKAIVAVDYAGQPCNYDALAALAQERGLTLISDACHSLGGAYGERSVGVLAQLTAFSFHPVKHITTGEGGAVTTADPELARKMRLFRNHGISTDHRQREKNGSFFYEMVDLGYNYRITDLQCRLGRSQLKKLPAWIERRREIAARYDNAFAGLPIQPVKRLAGAEHAYHLYPVLLDTARLCCSRADVFQMLRSAGLGVNVHYVPVHLHPYYRRTFGTGPGDCPVAEQAYERLLSIPMFPRMTDVEVASVVSTVSDVLGRSLHP